MGIGTVAGRGQGWGGGFPGGSPRDKVGGAGAGVGPLAAAPGWCGVSAMALHPHGTLFPGHAGLGRTPGTSGYSFLKGCPELCSTPSAGTPSPKGSLDSVGLSELWQPHFGGQGSSGHSGILIPKF